MLKARYRQMCGEEGVGWGRESSKSYWVRGRENYPKQSESEVNTMSLSSLSVGLFFFCHKVFLLCMLDSYLESVD